MDLKQCLLTKNDCYKKATKITPKGIIVHSTGANNPTLRRYVQPDDGILGVNKNKNDWNRSGISVCVHAFIGKDKNGSVRVYQTLPFNYACWGIGRGKKGSYNYDPTGYIQFEMCEDDLKNETYFNEVMQNAIEFCAYLCKTYNINVDNVISHHEGYLRGYGSNHSDCDHWLKKFGKDMNWFRNEVSKRVNGYVEPTQPSGTPVNYKVKINVDELNVRDGAGTQYKVNTTVKKNEVYTIVEESKGWGKLKSGAGWISLNCTIKMGTASNPTKTVSAKDGLNIRNEASLFGKKIGVLSKGTVVTIYATKGSWSKISSNSEQWVSSNYLK